MKILTSLFKKSTVSSSFLIFIYLIHNVSICYVIDFANGRNTVHYEANELDPNGMRRNEPKLHEAIKKLSSLRFYKPNQFEQQDEFEPNEIQEDQNDYSSSNELNKHEKIKPLFSPNNVQSPVGSNNYYPQQEGSDQYNRFMSRPSPMPIPLSHPSRNPYFNDKHNSQVYVDQTEFELPRLFITNVNKNLNINDLDKTDHIKDQDLNNYKTYKTHKLSMKAKNMTTTVRSESSSTQADSLSSTTTTTTMPITTTAAAATTLATKDSIENENAEKVSLINSL
jgi:hypothetical protein